PRDSAQRTDWAKFAHGMVSIWLTSVNGMSHSGTRQMTGVAWAAHSPKSGKELIGEIGSRHVRPHGIRAGVPAGGLGR
ncbi:MAG: hypothetical protein ACLP1D_06665, partial [Xanthobacteraceae bacterium]